MSAHMVSHSWKRVVAEETLDMLRSRACMVQEPCSWRGFWLRNAASVCVTCPHCTCRELPAERWEGCNTFSHSSQSCESFLLLPSCALVCLALLKHTTHCKAIARKQSLLPPEPCIFARGSDRSLCSGWRSRLLVKDSSFLVSIICHIFYPTFFSVLWLIEKPLF